MTTCREIQAEEGVLLREATAWRLIGLLFECPQDKWLDQVTMLGREVSDATLAAAAEAAGREASPGLYHSTFGPGGPAPPREVSYRRGVLPGPALAELRSLYEAFAYRPSVEEPADHVAVEAGFVGYLRLKQAYAHARGHHEQTSVCRTAEQRFIQEHLSHLARPLTQSLENSGISYLAKTAAALLARVGPPPAGGTLPVILEEEPDEDECLAH